ncbi:MAG: cytochrome c family protein [Pseudorhodobacter sp.]|nr:cytochrome c family protein [Pseudorhodobacter sp.]
MFNTMTITKVLGAVLGSLLVLLLVNWLASALYHTDGDSAEYAYKVDTGADEAAVSAVEAEVAEPAAVAEVAAPAAEVAAPAAEVVEPAVEAEAEAVVVAPAAQEGTGAADLLANADADAGKKVFNKCRACHKLDGKNGIGPHLDGVVNRAKASVEGFAYSAALKGMAGDTWTVENINAFLESPKDYAPGTKMTFAGLPKAEERANVIAYIAEQD